MKFIKYPEGASTDVTIAIRVNAKLGIDTYKIFAANYRFLVIIKKLP